MINGQNIGGILFKGSRENAVREIVRHILQEKNDRIFKDIQR